MESFIAINRLWSYNFLGGLKDYYNLDLDHKILNNVYEIVAEYVRIRYNFVAGYMTSVDYNQANAALNYRINEIDVEAAFVNWFLENVFRELAAALNVYPGSLNYVQPIDGGTGDIVGFVVRKTLH